MFAAPASAHSVLISSTPAPDSVLEQSPTEIMLTFTESVDIVDDSIRLVNASGKAVPIGEVRRGTDNATIAVDVGADLAGTYVVAWRAVSADSHPIGGAFNFSVGEVTAADPEVLAEALASSTADGSSGWLALGRWMSYAGVAVAVGGFAVLTVCAPSLLTSRRTRMVVAVSANVGMIGTALMIAAQAAVVGGGAFDPDGWVSVIESRSGRWWMVRLVALGLIPILFAVARRVIRRRGTQVAAAVYGIGVLLVVAAGGHGVTGRAVGVGFVTTVAHLAAMSVWVGGIVAIVAVVGRQGLAEVLERFSPVALGAVIALTATGLVNTWRQLDGLGSLTDSTYGQWLVVKVLVVSGVVAVAAFNRWLLRRNAESSTLVAAVGTVGAARRTGPEPSRFRRTVLVELIGMAIVLAATAGLVSTPPPSASAAAGAIPVSLTAAHGQWLAQIDLVPAATGGTSIHAYMFATDGNRDVADEITVTAIHPAQQVGPIDITTYPAGPNHVTSNEANFPLAGAWDITVTARFGDFDQIVLTVSAEIR